MTVLTAHEIHPTETVNHRGYTYSNYGLIFNLLEHFTPLDISKFPKTWRSKWIGSHLVGCGLTLTPILYGLTPEWVV